MVRRKSRWIIGLLLWEEEEEKEEENHQQSGSHKEKKAKIDLTSSTFQDVSLAKCFFFCLQSSL